MKYILAESNIDILKQFSWSKVLLAFDYDGTLAPIVTDPARAVMRPRTKVLLQELTQRYPCVVISGRSQADAKRLLRGVDLAEVIGNHGIEPWHVSAPSSQRAREWREILAKKLRALRGVVVEDKVYSVAVHYRQSREKKRARAAICAAASGLGEIRVIGGKDIVNILPPDAPHKGMALERLRDKLACDTAIFVGDDETDEDVFALTEPGRLLTIRVGAKRASAATYFIRDQKQIDLFLDTLVESRPGSSRSAAR